VTKIEVGHNKIRIPRLLIVVVIISYKENQWVQRKYMRVEEDKNLGTCSHDQYPTKQPYTSKPQLYTNKIVEPLKM